LTRVCATLGLPRCIKEPDYTQLWNVATDANGRGYEYSHWARKRKFRC
jgi:hypothetical protein